MINRDDMLDVPERRAVAQQFEVRSAGDNIARITGYASVFDRGYDVHGGPDAGGWTEVTTRVAFKRTLSENPHVHLLINHEGLPLASTKSKTLRLSTDSTGLITEAEVDRRNTRANDMILTLERGDADEMSFAFRVKGQTWSDDGNTRSLNEVSLHKGDVSVVSFGANPFTSVSVGTAVKALARQDFSAKELAELRAMGIQVDRAMRSLTMARDDSGESALEGQKSRRSITVTRATFAKQVHDLAVAGGANCDPGSAMCAGDMRSLGGGMEDGDVFDDDDDDEYVGGDSLIQAVHDMVVDEADDTDDSGDSDMTEPEVAPYGRNLTVADAASAARSPDNLTLADAARLCRPDEAPAPLTVQQAIQLAS